MAAVFWDGGGDGVNWTDASNWSMDALPGLGDDVSISAVGEPVIDLASGNQQILSLFSTEKLRLLGGTLSIGGSATISADLILSGGSLHGSAIAAQPDARLVASASGGTLDGVSFTGDIDASQFTGAKFSVRNGLTLNGTLYLGSEDGSRHGVIYFDDAGPTNQSLTGAAAVVFGGSAQNGIHNRSLNNRTVTLGDDVVIHGASGDIHNWYAGGTIVNRGTIHAETAGGVIYFGRGTGTVVNEGQVIASNGGILTIDTAWTNTGTIRAEANSTVNLGGMFTRSGIGIVQGSAGTINVTGTFDNTGGTFQPNLQTGSWRLNQGTIRGGVLDFTAGARVIPLAGTFDGVTVNGDLDITQQSGGYLAITHGLVLNGTAYIGSSDGLSEMRLLFGDGTRQDQALSGAATIIFGSHLQNRIQNSNGTLTIAPGVQVRGVNGIIENDSFSGGTVVNRGIISADVSGGRLMFGSNSSLGTMINEGLLTAEAGTTLTIGSHWKNNDGRIQATNATVNLGGTFTAPAPGSIVRAGGTVNLVGVCENLGTELTLDAGTGSWNLVGGTLIGGSVILNDGVRIVATQFGGTLDGVHIVGVVQVEHSNGARLSVKNSLTIDGTLYIGSQDGIRYGGVYFDDDTQTDQTLAGSATVVMATNSNRLSNRMTAGKSLTLAPGVVVRGRGGTIESQLAGTSIVNRGIISADEAGDAIYLGEGAGSFINEGILEAKNGGALHVVDMSPLDDPAAMSNTSGSKITLAGNLTGDTTNRSLFQLQGALCFSGGTPFAPRFLEAMSGDLGNTSAGFDDNFALGALVVEESGYLRLTNEHVNSPQATSEALYVNELIVSVGGTLDLNGIAIYARSSKVDGSITGGAVVTVPDGGRIEIGNPVAGTIGQVGQIDTWQFYGYSGASVAMSVNPGTPFSVSPPPPALQWGGVELLDPNGQTIATADSATLGALAAAENVILPATGLYTIRVRAAGTESASTGNYLLGVWDQSVDTATISLNQKVFGNIESPFSKDHWTFSARAGEQIRFDFVNASTTGLLFTLTDPSSAAVFAGQTSDSEVITLSQSGQYQLSVRGGAGQIGSYAFQLIATSVEELSLGVSASGLLAGTGDARLYRISIPEATSLLVDLQSAPNTNFYELYLSFDRPPTRQDYNYRSEPPAAAGPSIFVPSVAPGTWYVLVYGSFVPLSDAFTLTATLSDLVIRSITPTHHGNGTEAVITIDGAGFDRSTTVELIAADGTPYPASHATADSFSQLTARFPAGSAPAGTYTLRVSQADGDSVELPAAFQFESGGAAQVEARLILPASVGPSALATLYVEFANTGTVAKPAPLLVLSGIDFALMTLDQTLLVEGLFREVHGVPTGFSNTVHILASGATPGILQPGESGRIPVYFVGLSPGWERTLEEVEFSLSTLAVDDPTPVQWVGLEGSLRPDGISVEAWQPIFANFTAAAGNTWGQYVAMLNDNARYLGRLGRRVVDVGQLLAFEFLQADGLGPIRSLTSAADVAVEAPGLPLVFSRTFSLPISKRYETGILGRGWSHNWQVSLAVSPDGTVTVIGPGGSQRVFQPDLRSDDYFTQAGDHGKLLALGSGVFALQELDGTVYRFRADGKLDFVRDTNGNTITAGYLGSDLTSLTHSSGRSLQIDYSPPGRIGRITDSLGRQTVYTYDTEGEHLLAVQEFDGRVTSYSYDSGSPARQHALASITLPGGDHQFFSYDSAGRLESTTRDGGTERLDFSYGPAGQFTATNAAQAATIYSFDHRGLLVKTEDPLGNAVHRSYDAEFNLTEVVDPAGRPTQFVYDTRGNVVRSTDALGFSTTFAYSASFNRLTSVTDANLNTTRYLYDSRGNLDQITYANNSFERWTYDGLGQPTNWINRRGQPIAFVHDADGRVTSRTYPDGTQVTFNYNARGNLTSTVDSTGTTTLAYYPTNDRLQRITYPGGRFLEFTYDSAGRRQSSVDQLGYRLDYHYDLLGRLEAITDASLVEIVHYDYDAVGRLERQDLGNGVYTTYEYDLAGQLLHLVNHLPDGSLLSRFDYTYDSRGRRTSMGTVDGQWTYDYDDLGQLVHAVFVSTNPAIAHQDLLYVYDRLGNRIRTVENGVTVTYTTNALNQYTDVGGVQYHFDADGNLVSKIDGANVTTYIYDAENRLVSVMHGDNVSQYTYDALGNRVASATNGTTTAFVIDPIGLGNVVGEYDSQGQLVARNNYGIGLVSRTPTIASAGYYTFDLNGSTSEVVDRNGAILSRYAYSTFGSITAMLEGVSSPFRFGGRYGVMHDFNDLTFVRARYYKSELGRFTTNDPAHLSGGDLNLYRYVWNSPTQFTDASGLKGRMHLVWNREETAQGWYWHKRSVPERGEILEDIYLNLSQVVTEDGIFSPVVTLAHEYTHFFADQTFQPHRRESELLAYAAGLAVAVITRSPWDIANSASAVYGIVTGTQPWRYGGIQLPVPIIASAGIDTQLVYAKDPNQKLGPVGFGSEAFVSSGAALSYRIDFENDSTATAPAQRVDVTDPLGPDFDLESLTLHEVGFGDVLLLVPPGSQHFETTVAVHQNHQDFEVQIEIGVNPVTRMLRAVFQSIDPRTSLPPDVLTGFLPPEDGSGRGLGYLTYSVRPRSGLPSGTQLRNVARITFDFGETIATNQIDPHDPLQGTDPAKEAMNTIDAGVPSSAAASPPQSVQPTFTVSWSGSDEPGGSGIAHYTLYMSTDDGPFAPLVENTTETSRTVVGEPGRRYRFYTIAEDNVGHREMPPAEPDVVVIVPSPQVVGRRIFYNNSAFDGNNPVASASDDAAIAADKSALLPGQTATLANYTSFSKGINGLMIDVANLAGTPTAADFSFRTGNNNSVAAWTTLATAPSIAVRAGAGTGGSDRVTLTWPDNTITKRWLQVTMLANANTGLAANDVFYFGNAVGESGNSTSDAVVNATDEIGARTHPVGPFPTGAVTNLYDFNRDRLVNATDQIIARTNGTNPLTALRLIAVPAESGSGSAAAADASLVGLGDVESVAAALATHRRRHR